MLHEEIGQIEWQGEQVYRTPAHNALASRVIIDQLTPLLPKDSKEINAQVKLLHAMLDAATMTDLTHHRRDRRWGEDPDHRQSPRGDSVAAYHLPVSMARVRMKRTYGTSSATEMHATGSKIVAKNEIALSTNVVKRGTIIIMALTTTSQTGVILRLKDTMKGDQAFLSRFKEGVLASDLQTAKDQDVCWVLSGSFTPSTTDRWLRPIILYTTGSLKWKTSKEPYTPYRTWLHHSWLKRRGQQTKKNKTQEQSTLSLYSTMLDVGR
jgi:hypothetical protein